MTLKTAMQGRPREVRDGRLKRVEAVIERQERVPAEGNRDGFVLNRQHRRPRFFWTSRHIGHRGPPLPIRDRLLVDPVALRQSPQTLLTKLYRSTDRLSRGGAPVENLAHSASFNSGVENAPSKPGIKHLAPAHVRPAECELDVTALGERSVALVAVGLQDAAEACEVRACREGEVGMTLTPPAVRPALRQDARVD